jgi:RimJ/RimL family protein N-acetyltransferase
MFRYPEKLQGPTLTLTPLQEADRAGLRAAASDPQIWAGHPAKTRHLPEVFVPYFDTLLSAGGTVIARNHAGVAVGCSRFYQPPQAPDQIAIGYTFLVRALWGGAANAEMKQLMLSWAFEQVDQVWLHIDPSNLRSQRATAKIGATFVEEGSLVMAGKHGVWQSWCLTRSQWENGPLRLG